jgi:hypothetical protein
MTYKQVFTTLGLANCYGNCIAEGGGPSSHFWTFYTLHNGHNLCVITEFSGQGKSSLVSVSLDGASWNSDEKK